jgi:manganese/zinc/iron transport system substrate-binding protein
VRRLLAAAAALLALGAAGCASTSDEVARGDVSERKLRVTTTVNFLTDTVERIGGDRVEVTGLLGPGVDPHLYKASAGDVERLREADVVFYGGLELEGKVGDVLAELGEDKPVVAVSEAIPRDRLLRKPGRDVVDPHVWFDPELWLMAARRVAEELTRLDPAQEAAYRQRLELFTRSVEHVAEEAEIAIAQIPERRRVLVTSHDAFGYFGRAFGLRVEPIQGISTAAEATTADIKRVAGVIAERDVPAVFVESSVPRQTVEAVVAAARRRGQPVRIGGELFGDAAGERGTPEGSYAGMLQHNVREITEALR